MNQARLDAAREGVLDHMGAGRKQMNLTLGEIAEALELPLGTVKSRLAYALARLRETVAD